MSLTAPDRNGEHGDVVLGYERLADYRKATPYFGAVVGRYGNRIAGGKFTLDSKAYTLATNNEPGGVPCHLHGGKVGFDKVLWDAEALIKAGAVGVRFHYVSPNRGRVALKRGPIVYCIEGADHQDGVLNLVLSDDTALRVSHRPDLLGGLTLLRGGGLAIGSGEEGRRVVHLSVSFILYALSTHDMRFAGVEGAAIVSET